MHIQNIAERDGFFGLVTDQVRAKLPKNLGHVKIKFIPGKNWVKFTYPGDLRGQYELHLAKRSKNHAGYFGSSEVDIVAFYFKAKPETRARWLERIRVYESFFSQQFAEPVVIGNWGQDWVWLALNLQKYKTTGYDLDVFSTVAAKFINTTYGPIKQAFKDMEQSR